MTKRRFKEKPIRRKYKGMKKRFFWRKMTEDEGWETCGNSLYRKKE